MYILGISSFAHEAGAALLKNGKICNVVEEERFNREKHTWKFPKNAIQFCLDQEGITFDDISYVTFFWQPFREITGNLKHVFRYLPNSLHLLRQNSGSEELTFLNRMRKKSTIAAIIRQEFGLKKKPNVIHVEHHLAHAASAFYVTPFEEAAILTIDGRGESTCTMFSHGKGNKISKLKEINVPHSLGHLYASITEYLGFKPFFDEWKIMGMSAYGKPTYLDEFAKIVHLSDDGYQLDLSYFHFHTHGRSRWLSQKFFDIFGPTRKKSDDYDERHYDIAFALQKTVERAGVHLANRLYEMTKSDTLCMAGGVVLNCLMNQKIVEESKFKNYFFQPIANDAGTTFGSALYYYHHVLDQKRDYIFNSVYLGPNYSNAEIESALKLRNLRFHKSNNIAKDTAKEIAEGKIVGWFQGKMEAGPRALGNRSITVSPLIPAMKDKLNARVKRREEFRPFAPSVLEERVDDFFQMPKKQLSPYMILIGNVKEDKAKTIPAVTHVDNTARVHTVSKNVNRRYHDLISEFEKITGVPVLINTSFNENEPIVNTPIEAVDCFLRTEFDTLAIGDYLVTKDSQKNTPTV